MQNCVKSILLFIFGSLPILSSLAQPSNLGNPPVKNFEKKTFNGGPQTWALECDSFGFTWFANNGGLLKFDGYNWDKYQVKNNTIVRSLAIGQNGEVFIGCQGDFGYFKPDMLGKMIYISLAEQLPSQERNFEDVWNVISGPEGVLFRTNKQVFLYKDGKVVTLLSHSSSLNFIGKWGKEVVLQYADGNLFVYKNGKFEKKPNLASFREGRISSVVNYLNDTILIATIDSGIFYEDHTGFKKWTTSDDDFLKKNIIFCASRDNKDQLVIGTSFTGLITIDRNHRINHVINKKKGLQNNSILCIGSSMSGDVWLGLDNGISLVRMNSAFRSVYPDGAIEGSGYAAAMFNHHLYFGTNTGLYVAEWKNYYRPDEKEKFGLVENSRGQVWGLNLIDDFLLMGHHEGGFDIKGSSANKFSPLQGTWKFLKISNNELVSGTYNGLALFKQDNHSWRLDHELDGFDESSRIMALDSKGEVWIAHPYRGIYHIPKSELFKEEIHPELFNEVTENGTAFQKMIYHVQNKILLVGDDKLYELDERNQPKPYYELDPYIDTKKHLKFLLEDEYENIWYGVDGETGMLVPEKSFERYYKKYILNELNGRLPEGFQTVFSIDKNNVIFPTDKGFLFLDPEKYMSIDTEFKLYLSKLILTTNKDSILYNYTGFNSDFNEIHLDYNNSNIKLFYSVDRCTNSDIIQYSHRVEGSGSQWSEWSDVPTLTFNKLSSGDYNLHVKARNELGKESQIHTIAIHVSFPWYRSTLAYLIYGLFILFAGYFMMLMQRKRHEEEKSHLEMEGQKREQEHLINAEISKGEIIRLQNEKLLAELEHKNQELSSFTYNLVNKNELINGIKTELNKLEKKFHDNQDLKKELRHIHRLADQNVAAESDWENFISNFDQVHADFFKRLTEEYQDLSPNDYKLCTYLRMNLASKEIASLMNISIRSVETNRYRLRKKLNLSSDTNLGQFLMKY